MKNSRRSFLCGSIAASFGSTALICSGGSAEVDRSRQAVDILSPFDSIPGQKGIKMWAPATGNKREFLVNLNPNQPLFCGSSFKAFVLCEALRQKDAPDIDKQLQDQQLDLNEAVWSPDSQTFNPPNLSGKVSEKTALEAMIIHSDNTAADMILNYIGTNNVRQFLRRAGLHHSDIPNSTRQFFGYLAGFSDWQNTTWDEVDAFVNGNRPFVNSPVNPVQTMASSPRDFVSFYARSLQGEFFKNAATLDEYRGILSRADAIQQAIPLGASAFLKGGAIDVNPFHALCLAGGMYLSERWVYFATIVNWNYAGDADLVTAGAFINAIARAFESVKRILSD